MFETVGEFAAVSQLNDDEISALREIIADKALMTKAAALEAHCFDTPIEKWDGCKIDRIEGGDHSRIRYAAMFLGARRIPGFYADYGFPEAVMRETMTDLKVWLRNEMQHRGVCGLNIRALEWQVALYRGLVTRHGRLECNSEYAYKREVLTGADGSVILSPGDQVINLHIPEDGPLRIDDCLASMRRMAAFFAEYRPHIQWKGFLCESWLLDTQLRAMLPEHSNIIKFQDLGQRYYVCETTDSIFRIFGTPEADPNAVKNPTSLQRKAAEFIRDGGKFIEEGMFIPKSILD